MSFQIQSENRYTGERVSLGPQKKPSTCVWSVYCKIFVFVARHTRMNSSYFVLLSLLVCSVPFFHGLQFLNDSLKCCCRLLIVHLFFYLSVVSSQPSLWSDTIWNVHSALPRGDSSNCSFRMLFPERWQSLNMPKVLFDMMMSGHKYYK